MSDFNYEDGLESGTEVQGGGKVKNEVVAAKGDHAARIRSIVHCGVSEAFFDGQSKGKHPKCVIVFELKEDGDFETDGVTPLTVSKDIEIKKGEKANVELLRAAFLKADGEKASNFNELIGCVGTVKIGHSKDGKYANVVAFNKGGVSGYPRKFAGMLPELVGGVGNVKFSDMTLDALRECHGWYHVQDLMLAADGYEGSVCEQRVTEMRAIEGFEYYANREAAMKAAKSKPTPTDEGQAKATPAIVDDGAEY